MTPVRAVIGTGHADADEDAGLCGGTAHSTNDEGSEGDSADEGGDSAAEES